MILFAVCSLAPDQVGPTQQGDFNTLNVDDAPIAPRVLPFQSPCSDGEIDDEAIANPNDDVLAQISWGEFAGVAFSPARQCRQCAIQVFVSVFQQDVRITRGALVSMQQAG